MSRVYLKKAQLTPKSNASEVHETVKNILTDIEAGGDEKAKEYASKFDQYQGNIILTDEEIEAASELVPAKLKKDIEFAHDNVRRFAEKQKETLKNTEIEIWDQNKKRLFEEPKIEYTVRSLNSLIKSINFCKKKYQ